MALNLSPEEQAAYDKATTNVPAGAVIPNPVDILNGTASANDIVLTMPSGLQQDIDQADESIVKAAATIVKFEEEISMNFAYVNHYTNFLSHYEDEIKLTNGSYEASTWNVSEISEANNIFHGASSRYFPSGYTTSPLELNNFDEETYSGPKIHTNTNIKSRFAAVEAAIDVFTATYSNAERIANVPNGTFPDPPTLMQIADFEAMRDAIPPLINSFMSVLTTILPLFAFPYVDDENATAPASAAAREVNVLQLQTDMTPYVGVTIFTDAVLASFQIFRSNVASDADARVIEIATFATPAFYGQRASFAVELADLAEGAIWKKLNETEGRNQTIKRRDKLQRKLNTYNGIL